MSDLIENSVMTSKFYVKSSHHNEKYEFPELTQSINLMELISRHLNTKADRVINYEWNNNSYSMARIMFEVL